MKKFLFLIVILTITLFPLSSAAAAPEPQIDPLCLLEKIISGEGVSWATNLGDSILIHMTSGGAEATALVAHLESQGWKDAANAKWNGKIKTMVKRFNPLIEAGAIHTL
jgi:hypothetical protein